MMQAFSSVLSKLFDQLHFVLSRWGKVILSTIGCLITVSICATLGYFHGTKPPNWPLNLTVQSLVAAQSTIVAWCTRTSLVMSSCALCWYYVRNLGSRLRDFGLLLDPIGTPLAVLKLAFHAIRERRYLAILIATTLVGNEACHFFTQQAINTVMAPTVVHTATLPRCVAFNEWRPGPVPGLGNIPQELQHRTATAMFENDPRQLQVRHHCPGLRCHWISTSLAVASQCLNVTYRISTRNSCVGNRCNYYLPHDGPSLVNSYTAGTPVFNTTTSITSWAFPYIKQPLFVVQMIAKETKANVDIVRAYECIEFPQVEMYETHVDHGVFFEKTLQVWRNHSASFADPNPNEDNLAFITLNPGRRFGSDQFTESQKAWISQQYAFIGDFRASIVENVPYGNRAIAQLLHRASLDGYVDQLVAKHALAITTFMREHDAYRSHARGTSMTEERVFVIRWGWLIFPILISISAQVLSIVTTFRSYKSDTYRLDHDALAVLEAGLYEDERPFNFQAADHLYYLDGAGRLTRRRRMGAGTPLGNVNANANTNTNASSVGLPQQRGVW